VSSGRVLALALAALGFVWLMPHGAAASTGVRVAARVTGGRDAHAWASSRFAALRAHVASDDEARALLTHCAIETSWGSAEYAWNVGNIRPTSPKERRFVLPKVPGAFRAYGSLSEGVGAYVGLLRARYASCVELLSADPTSVAWYECLATSGYFGLPAPTNIAPLYDQVRARVETLTS
jgi:hypothetical protein